MSSHRGACALLVTLAGSASCGSAARDTPRQPLDSQRADVTSPALPPTEDLVSSSPEPSSRFVDIAAAPLAGVSKLAPLPNGDSLTIPFEYELLERQGTDSRIGELLDAEDTVLCRYDIGPFGASVTAARGTREQAANQIFYYWQAPPYSEEGRALWEATFGERGPANFYCEVTLSGSAFLGLMRTYTASSQAPFEGL